MLERQNSSRSSRTSSKSTGSQLQKKIEELCLQKTPDEWQKEQEYNCRRIRRKQLEKQLQANARRIRLRHARYLFIPAGLGFFVGLIMIFGATLRNLSEGSIFWTHRKYFVVVGPVIMVCGLILFFVAEGVGNSIMGKLRKSGAFELKQIIHPDFHVTNKTLLREENGEAGKRTEADKLLQTDESLLCSSISSTSSVPDFASRWVHAMSLSFDKSRRIQRSESTESDNSTDSAMIRALVNAPDIEITAPDDRENNAICVNGGPPKPLIKSGTPQIPNGKNGSILRVESVKSFQLFQLEGISEENLTEIRTENG